MPFLRRPRFLLATSLAVVVMTLVVWRAGLWPGLARPTTPVRIAYAPVVLNLPLFVALDRGWFTEAGLKVEATPFTSANDMISALAASRVDAVTGVSAVPVFHLETNSPGRARVILHSRMTPTQAYDSIIVGRDSTIGSIGDLKGRKIGVYPGTTATNLLRAFLRTQSLAPALVPFVQLAPPNHISALESGSVDALLAYEPTLTVALSRGAKRLHGSIFVDMLNPSPISVSVVSRAFEQAHPRETEVLTEVLDRAIRAIRIDPAAFRSSLAQHTKLPSEVASRVSLVPDTLSSEVDANNLQQFVDLLGRIGELNAPLSVRRLLSEGR
jgi:ABC-type nitrate/sulfonate/bicarbonate transport system substrate-binding protein